MLVIPTSVTGTSDGGTPMEAIQLGLSKPLSVHEFQFD